MNGPLAIDFSKKGWERGLGKWDLGVAKKRSVVALLPNGMIIPVYQKSFLSLLFLQLLYRLSFFLLFSSCIHTLLSLLLLHWESESGGVEPQQHSIAWQAASAAMLYDGL